MADKEEQAPARVSNNWFSYHLAIVPIGTVGVTWLLLFVTGDMWHWWSREEDLVMAGQVAPFAAAVYGMFIFLAERIGRKAWSFFSREKALEEARKEPSAEGYRQGQRAMADQLDERGIDWRQ